MTGTETGPGICNTRRPKLDETNVWTPAKSLSGDQFKDANYEIRIVCVTIDPSALMALQ